MVCCIIIITPFCKVLIRISTITINTKIVYSNIAVKISEIYCFVIISTVQFKSFSPAFISFADGYRIPVNGGYGGRSKS